MKFAEGRIANRVQVPIVSVCNRQCPECCARERLTWYNKQIKELEIPIEELRRVGNLIGKIGRIEITGGEPTLHSKFEELTNNLETIFQCNDFMLVTNGWLFGKDPSKLPLLLKYQRVWVSHYTEQFVARHGGVSNTFEYMLVTQFLQAHHHLNVMKVQIDGHVPYGEPPYEGTPCAHYWSDMIAYHEGQLFGCCVAWSLPLQGKGIPLTSEWRDHVKEIELPCETCFRSGGR